MIEDAQDITDKLVRAVCRGLESGLSESQACRLEDILPDVFSTLRKENPEIEHKIERAKARRVKQLLKKYNDEDLTSPKQKAIQNQLETTDPRFAAKGGDTQPLIDMSGMVLAPAKSEREAHEITPERKKLPDGADRT